MPDKRHRESTKPIETLKLMAEAGPSSAARKLGVSTTTLYTARKTNVVSKVVETAAAGIRKSGKSIGKTSTMEVTPEKLAEVVERVQEYDVFIIDVPKDKVDLVRHMSQAIGAKLMQ